MYRILIVTILVLLVAGTVSAAVVTLPDTTQTTTFTATVSPQANVTIPSGITFTVTNVSADTASAAQSVSATSIVLTDGMWLQVMLKADALNFTPPTGGSVTWSCYNVSWNAATWTNGTGSSGTLSSGYDEYIVNTNPNAGSTSTTNLVFTLGDKATVDRAGNHTLVCTWKIWANN